MKLRLNDLRKAAGLSQADLAERLGIPQTTYSSWEREESKIPLSAACLVADYFNVTLDELAGRKPPCSSTQESTLFDIYAGMSREGQDALLASAKGLHAAYPARQRETLSA